MSAPSSVPGLGEAGLVAADAAPYETLVAMIEHELELAGEGRFADLGRANDERTALMTALPDPSPAWALPLLQRADMLHRSLTMELQRRRDAILLEVAAVERAQRAAHGYKPVSFRRPRFSSSA